MDRGAQDQNARIPQLLAAAGVSRAAMKYTLPQVSAQRLRDYISDYAAIRPVTFVQGVLSSKVASGSQQYVSNSSFAATVLEVLCKELVLMAKQAYVLPLSDIREAMFVSPDDPNSKRIMGYIREVDNLLITEFCLTGGNISPYFTSYEQVRLLRFFSQYLDNGNRLYLQVEGRFMVKGSEWWSGHMVNFLTRNAHFFETVEDYTILFSGSSTK